MHEQTRYSLSTHSFTSSNDALGYLQYSKGPTKERTWKTSNSALKPVIKLLQNRKLRILYLSVK